MLFVFFISLEAEFENVQFEKLDFGEIFVLDLFYNADVVIVDMSIFVQQSVLFYYIGVRQSMEMKFNIVFYYDVDFEQFLVFRVSSFFFLKFYLFGSIIFFFFFLSRIYLLFFFLIVFFIFLIFKRVLIFCFLVNFGLCI